MFYNIFFFFRVLLDNEEVLKIIYKKFNILWYWFLGGFFLIEVCKGIEEELFVVVGVMICFGVIIGVGVIIMIIILIM